MPPVLLVYTSIRYRLPRFSPKTILYHDAVKIQLPPPGGDGATRRVADPWWGHPPGATSPDVRVQPRAAAALLGRFLWSCSKKASQTPKGKPLATVSHDPAATLPGTVSHRAERISGSGSIARLRRPCQKQLLNLHAAQPSCTHHPSAVREAILYLPEKHASLAERRSDVMSELSGPPGSEGYGIRDDEVGDAQVPSD